MRIKKYITERYSLPKALLLYLISSHLKFVERFRLKQQQKKCTSSLEKHAISLSYSVQTQTVSTCYLKVASSLCTSKKYSRTLRRSRGRSRTLAVGAQAAHRSRKRSTGVWRSGTGEVAGGEVGLEHFGCMVGGLGRGVDAVVCLSSF